ncbi:MAG: hypothetical protein ABR587_04055 [Candidatus Binatia bacterium]
MLRVPFAATIFVGLVIVTFVLPASATPVTLGRTETATDYVSAGLGGLGNGGGSFTVTGVSGGVRKAFLYWHGIGQGTGAVYDNPTISFAGTTVTGFSLGDAATNCWGTGSSRAFFADVTPLVNGNGSYAISGLNSGVLYSGNGASLIVLFNDTNDDNDRDLVFFEGNDSDVVDASVPNDPAGWAATLSNINYTGGQVFAQMHVGDGQSFPDGSLTFTGASIVNIPDTGQLWDGISVPNAGFSRAGVDSLWDIHTFDITAAFGEPGLQTIDLTGMLSSSDCHSLVALMLDLRAGSAPCGNGELDDGEECDPGSRESATCSGVESCVGDCSCGCTNDFQCNDGTACTNDSCDVETGACSQEPACASGPGCTDTCDEANGACRLCGSPVSNSRCIVNAVYVLQAALDLRSCELCTCDVDSSESVTVTDALLILRSCTGLPAELMCMLPETSTTTTNP